LDPSTICRHRPGRSTGSYGAGGINWAGGVSREQSGKPLSVILDIFDFCFPY